MGREGGKQVRSKAKAKAKLGDSALSPFLLGGPDPLFRNYLGIVIYQHKDSLALFIWWSGCVLDLKSS